MLSPKSTVKKTKVMAITAQKEHIHIMCQGCQLEQMERFKYLGTIFTEMGVVITRSSATA